jgi:hypothetical protein
MSYETEINSNIQNISRAQTEQFLNILFAGSLQAGGPNNISFNTKEHTGNNGKNVYSGTIHNTERNNTVYNLYDLIASAKYNDVSNTDIALALNAAGIPNPNANDLRWNNTAVKTANSNTTKGTQQLQAYLTERYPAAEPYVSVLMDSNGEKYIVRVVYKDANGNLVYTRVDEPKAGRNGHYKESELQNIIGNLNATDDGTTLTELSQQTVNKANANTQLNNNTAAMTAIDKLLNGSLANAGGGAKTNYTLTDAEKQSMTAKAPDLSTQQVGNAVNNSSWIDNIVAGLKGDGVDSLTGLDLAKHKGNADTIKEAVSNLLDVNINKARNTATDTINNQNARALIESLSKQQQADLLKNISAGKRIGNLGDLIEQGNIANKEAAQSLYDSLFGGDNNVADTQRAQSYAADKDALSTYTEQQLQKIFTDQNLFGNDVTNLTSAAALLQSMIDAEMMRANREAEDARTEAEVNKNNIVADKEAAATESRGQDIANANLATKNANTLTQLLDNSNEGVDLATAIQNFVDNGGGSGATADRGTRVTHNYDEQKYIDETTYQRLLDSGILDFLSPEAYKKYTESKTAQALADEYGVGYLGNEQDTVAGFEDIATKANEASDRKFNAAQRAYIAAIAAGDASTAEQLARLANNANTTTRGLYNAERLLQQFNQQYDNKNVGNTLNQDWLAQQAKNKQQLGQAFSDATQSWNKWTGPSNEYGNSLQNSLILRDQAVAGANDAYSKIASAGMGSQSNYNNLLSQNNNFSNNLISQAAANITGINATNAGSNTQTKADVTGTKLGLQLQQDVLAAQNKRLEDIAKTGVIS